MKSSAFVLILSLLCGCSSFTRQWHRAAIPPATANSIEGPWQGTWRSDVNHHHGKLLCLMVHDTNSVYQAHFRATYAHIFHFGYTVPLQVEPHFGGWEFNGEANLGKLAGGAYYYEGRASATNLFSTYKSTSDKGIFKLARPGKG